MTRRMFNSKEIILPLIVAIILMVLPIWMILNYGRKFFYYQQLSTSGIETGATLINKKMRFKENKLLRPFITNSTVNYRFLVAFDSTDKKRVRCELGVSKDTYYSIDVRDELLIIYPPDNPKDCTLPHWARVSRYFLLMTLVVAVILIILSICLFYYIYTSFKKPRPGEVIKITTNMDLDKPSLNCPKCAAEMTEGYMPAVGGVSWRDKDEPIGIPTMRSGLPGTTFFIKRPLLHAFHCKTCKIIVFKYGKER